MKGRLFLFHWDKNTAADRAEQLRADGWKVEVESEDGARGGGKVLKDPPDVIVMDLSRKPSHSRETANGLRGYDAGRNLPIVFVDGEEMDIEKTKRKVSDAIFTSSSGLKRVLARYIGE